MKQLNTTVDPRVAVTLFDFALWFLARANRLPKNWRVTLGDRIDGTLLNLDSWCLCVSVRGKQSLTEPLRSQRVDEDM